MCLPVCLLLHVARQVFGRIYRRMAQPVANGVNGNGHAQHDGREREAGPKKELVLNAFVEMCKL